MFFIVAKLIAFIILAVAVVGVPLCAILFVYNILFNKDFDDGIGTPWGTLF